MRNVKLNSVVLILMIVLSAACGRQISSNLSETSPAESEVASRLDPDAQIAKYVVGMLEDRHGNLWFGTLGKGVARYNGTELNYFTINDGLPGNAVVNIVEDKTGDLWFGTQSGLSRYDGNTFTNFRMEGGEAENRISSLIIDSQDQLWIGTWGGVYRLEGTEFRPFELPVPDVELLSYQTTMDWITEIQEDSRGNIWIGRDGYGFCKFDGDSFTHFTKKDGLPSNNVFDIHEDQEGNIWFGTRVAERDHPDAERRTGAGGLSLFDGDSMREFPEFPGLSESDVYTIFQDQTGHIWVSTIGHGVYRYDGTSFRNYQQAESLTMMNPLVPFFGIQSMLEDSKGNMWFGCSGGLFRLEGEAVVNVKVGGPWE